MFGSYSLDLFTDFNAFAVEVAMRQDGKFTANDIYAEMQKEEARMAPFSVFGDHVGKVEISLDVLSRHDKLYKDSGKYSVI